MSADLFVYFDTAQFSKNGLQNRNQIKTASGPGWLTLPVKQGLGQAINEMRLAQPAVLPKHFRTIQMNYAGRPGFVRWQAELAALLERPRVLLYDILYAATEWMLGKLEISTERIEAGSLPVADLAKSELIASMCESLGATEYLTGTGALAYLNPADFSRIGCKIRVQTWTAFEYPQAHPKLGFVPGLSTLDLLLNCPDTAKSLIASAGGWRPLGPA